MHLWTIKDAKDGDVLAWDNGDERIGWHENFIFIYNNTSNLQAYCSYSKEENRFIIEDMSHHCKWNMQEVTPVTNEQRDLLFRKMRKAGYEWDAEKKKLNKNKQKPTEWSTADERCLDDALYAVEQAKTIAKDENDMDSIWYAEKWLKSLKDRFFSHTKKQS